MIRYYSVLGDKTTAGGSVIGASSSFTINGATMAVEGDFVQCPVCHISAPIVCVGPRPLKYDGRSVALSGDQCACECLPAPTLLHSQESAFYKS